MNEDYLWDKTGEPDAEIERLEKTLGSLRFKRPAEPLPLPAVTPRHTFRLNSSPALAAAAALLILILAGGIWLGLRPAGPPGGQETIANVATPPEEKRTEAWVSGPPRPPIGPDNPRDPSVAAVDEKESNNVPQGEVDSRRKLPRRFSAPRRETARRRGPNSSPRRQELAREGEEAKAQLIMALHIASDKLSAVQKRIQTDPGT